VTRRRVAAWLVAALTLAACGEGVTARSQAPTTTATAITVTSTTTTTTTTWAAGCGTYPDYSDLVITRAPGTTTPPAPVDTSLQARALREADVPCTRFTTMADLRGEDPQFSPCGFPFGDTSAALARYEVTLLFAFRWPQGPDVKYVQEQVARYPSEAAAAQVLRSFRAKVDACPGDGFWGGRLFHDVPNFVVNGEVRPQAYDLQTVDLAVDADDAFAVLFFCCKPGRHLMAAMRTGAYVAFVRLFYEHGRDAAAAPVLAAAAARLRPA